MKQWYALFVLLCSYRVIDNLDDDLYMKTGRFKLEVDPHHFNLRIHHFLQFHFSVRKQKLEGLWLAGKVVNHVGIYGSEVAEGFSVFQLRSWKVRCLCYYFTIDITIGVQIPQHFLPPIRGMNPISSTLLTS